MACHETKYCPRCKSPFECKVGSISECQCNVVKLDEAQRREIAANYSDCLCASCLVELQKEMKQGLTPRRFQLIRSIFRLR
ncbi:MAG: hypothetical protein EOO09_15765 [Chitinophagaceae bacterium]|nr:MAG: hypothetical protein EOO09_15765 [Chitinophagaceae bacterium]